MRREIRELKERSAKQEADHAIYYAKMKRREELVKMVEEQEAAQNLMVKQLEESVEKLREKSEAGSLQAVCGLSTAICVSINRVSAARIVRA